MGFGDHGEYGALRHRFPGKGAGASACAPKGAFRSSSFGIDVQIPSEDVDRFNAAIAALVQVAGQARGDAVLHGAMSLAAALRAATKQSAKFRKIKAGYETQTRNARSWRNPIWVRERFVGGAPVEEFAGYRAGKDASAWVLARASTRQQAKENSRIRNRGLAKSAWFWFLSHMGKSGGASSAAGLPDAAQFVEMTQRHDAVCSQITMYNRLSYARDAFSGGRRTPENSYARAAGIMEHYIDRQLATYCRRFG